MTRLLALPPGERPTAVFAIADNLGMIIERCAVQAGLNVPHDLSVFGFGNAPETEYAVVPLSTVEESFAKRDELAVRLLIEGSCGIAPVAPGFYLVDPVLVFRNSTAKNKNWKGEK